MDTRGIVSEPEILMQCLEYRGSLICLERTGEAEEKGMWTVNENIMQGGRSLSSVWIFKEILNPQL